MVPSKIAKIASSDESETLLVENKMSAVAFSASSSPPGMRVDNLAAWLGEVQKPTKPVPDK